MRQTRALAADSDDEKRLERAERMAERRAGANRRKLEEADKLRKSLREAQEKGRTPARSDSVPTPAAAKPLLPRPAGPVICFGWGEAGHVRRDCPKRPVLAYPFTLVGGSVPVSTGGEWSTCGEVRSGVGLSLDVLQCVELPPDVLQFDAPEGSPCLAEEVVSKGRCWEIEDSKISVLDGMAVRGRLRQHIFLLGKRASCHTMDYRHD